jgi:hypothetical protein
MFPYRRGFYQKSPTLSNKYSNPILHSGGKNCQVGGASASLKKIDKLSEAAENSDRREKI